MEQGNYEFLEGKKRDKFREVSKCGTWVGSGSKRVNQIFILDSHLSNNQRAQAVSSPFVGSV